MNIPLVQGSFNNIDTLDLLNQMVQLKIRFHENKISTSSSEEDIKYRETKIKRLQHDLMELKKFILEGEKHHNIDVQINLEKTNS